MTSRRHNDIWSDSEDEERPSGVETGVLLGIPDGKIENEDDLIDAAVSRVGGLPALLPLKEPSFTSSCCKSCLQPMELLVQLWCPFENSPMDRALYVWGCARTGCQGKEDSVRAWRGLRYNEAYAAKLKRRRDKTVESRRKKVEHTQKTLSPAQSNPFTMPGDAPLGGNIFHHNPFSFDAQSFDTSILSKVRTSADEDPVEPPSCDAEDENNGDDRPEEDKNGSDSASSEFSLIAALASTQLIDSAWRSAPSYSPSYLSTSTEYLPPQYVPKLPKGLKIENLVEGDKTEDGITWVREKYEDSLYLDQVFERFAQRVAIEGKQCLRYELGGSPLPFASDKVYDLLWPKPVSQITPTPNDFKIIPPSFNATNIPRCPSCNASRVFECQLMPNLINTLSPTLEDGIGKKIKKMTDEERRKQIELFLKKSEANKDEKRGMEWGTCLIFSCEKNCCLEDGKDVKEVWREEAVYIQWDS